MEKLSIGVIGVGHLGKLHSKMFNEISNCNFVGVFDSNQEQAKAVADEFGVKSFKSLDELLSNVKAVSVAATTTAHYEVAKKCFEKNIHVFVEKPITAAIEEGEELVKLAKEKNLKFQVGHIERFNPGLLSLESFISDPMFIQSIDLHI
jgi:predicted dehydrogenase